MPPWADVVSAGRKSEAWPAFGGFGFRPLLFATVFRKIADNSNRDMELTVLPYIDISFAIALATSFSVGSFVEQSCPPGPWSWPSWPVTPRRAKPTKMSK
jgi:hypothetical protein